MKDFEIDTPEIILASRENIRQDNWNIELQIERAGLKLIKVPFDSLLTNLKNRFVNTKLILIDLQDFSKNEYKELQILTHYFPKVSLVGLIDSENVTLLEAEFKCLLDDIIFKSAQKAEIYARIKWRIALCNKKKIDSEQIPFVDRRKADRRKAEANNNNNNNNNNSLTNQEFLVVESRQQIFFKDQLLDLTTKEYELLHLLVSNLGRLFSDTEILFLLWRDNPVANESYVQQYIHRLRKKIETNPCNPEWIINVKGAGYFLKDPRRNRDQENKDQAFLVDTKA